MTKSQLCGLLTVQAERLLAIDRMLCGATVPLEQLHAIGISRATLNRDLKMMRDEFGAPLKYDAFERGYRLTAKWDGIAAQLIERLAPQARVSSLGKSK